MKLAGFSLFVLFFATGTDEVLLGVSRKVARAARARVRRSPANAA